MFIEQKLVMENRGWTAALFLLVSFQLERNATERITGEAHGPSLLSFNSFRVCFL